jgi:putative membrane protein
MVIALTVVALAAIYATGVRNAWRAAGVGHGIPTTQVYAVAGAMSVLVVALLSPLDAMSDELFAAHMVQHVLLAAVVPPLLVAGAFELGVFWAMPRVARRRLGRAVVGSRGYRLIWRALTLPAVACALHAVAIWSWHAPRLYELALHNEAVHAAEHVCFVGTGVLLWWRIIHPRGDRRAASGVGIAVLFVTAMQTGVLGALITVSRRVLYPGQTSTVAPWGLSPLADQQLAGLIMWVVGGLLYVVAMSILFIRWLEPNTGRRARRLVTAAAVGVAGGGMACGRAEATPVPGGDVERGKEVVTAMGCGSCHDIAGLRNAEGQVGPPLAGVRNRAIIGGALPNTPDNMMLWIEDPPSIAPNTAMPNLGVSPQQARDIVAYLYTLK